MRKQDRNSTHKNATFRRVTKAWLPRKNNNFIFCVFVYSLSYSEWKANEPYCIASVACLAVSNFSTLSYKRRDFRKKKLLLDTKLVFRFSLQLLSETFPILRIIERVIINVHTSTCKVPVILGGFRRNLNFLDKVLKNPQISSFILIRPVAAELFHVDRRIDMTRLTPLFAILRMWQKIKLLKITVNHGEWKITVEIFGRKFMFSAFWFSGTIKSRNMSILCQVAKF